MATGESQQKLTINDESSVLAEYLELFDCLGYRYKYFMAPNAHLDWFGTFQIRSPLMIHEFLLEKFGGKCRHANFSKAVSCGPIETRPSHMRTQLPTHAEVDLINPKNIVPKLKSLKNRAESDIEDDVDVEMVSASTIEPATSSNRVETKRANSSSDEESEEYNIRRCKRMKYNASSPFHYLKRLPTKKPQETGINHNSDDDDSSTSSSCSSSCTTSSTDNDDDDDDNDNDNDNNHIDTDAGKKDKRQQLNCSEYSQLYYLEAVGKILKSKPRHLGGGFAERPVRLRIAYRKHHIDGSTQFALIIYERQDQKTRTIRSRRMLDFSLCNEDGEQSESEDIECVGAQPVLIRSNEDGIDQETISTEQTPTSAEISTALEEAVFTIQPPIQRTPIKSTPIPPGTPKRRPRTTHLNMSGTAPLTMSSTKKLSSTPGTTPKLSAARSLRL